jgi:hypothetical protein
MLQRARASSAAGAYFLYIIYWKAHAAGARAAGAYFLCIIDRNYFLYGLYWKYFQYVIYWKSSYVCHLLGLHPCLCRGPC